jgi:hypothetical protein
MLIGAIGSLSLSNMQSRLAIQNMLVGRVGSITINFSALVLAPTRESHGLCMCCQTMLMIWFDRAAHFLPTTICRLVTPHPTTSQSTPCTPSVSPNPHASLLPLMVAPLGVMMGGLGMGFRMRLGRLGWTGRMGWDEVRWVGVCCMGPESLYGIKKQTYSISNPSLGMDVRL